MEQARAHRRLAGIGAFALLALVSELVGRSLTVSLDLGKHVPTPSYAGAEYYPFLLAGVKVSVALMLAVVTWRALRARASARAGRRLLAAVGGRPVIAPRLRVELRLRTWSLAFLTTSCFYLLQTDTERITVGEWPLVSPWLHTSALSVFAVLAVVVAVLYEGVARWLRDYERYVGEIATAAARSLARALRAAPLFHDSVEVAPPRRLFGLSFESRPPPLPA
jgi:hypothetical protein